MTVICWVLCTFYDSYMSTEPTVVMTRLLYQFDDQFKQEQFDQLPKTDEINLVIVNWLLAEYDRILRSELSHIELPPSFIHGRALLAIVATRTSMAFPDTEIHKIIAFDVTRFVQNSISERRHRTNEYSQFNELAYMVNETTYMINQTGALRDIQSSLASIMHLLTTHHSLSSHQMYVSVQNLRYISRRRHLGDDQSSWGKSLLHTLYSALAKTSN